MSRSTQHNRASECDDAIDDAAHDWVILFMSDTPTGADLARFETWRHIDPRHDAAYLRALELWNDSAAFSDRPQTIRMSGGSRMLPRLRWAAAGICLLTVVALGPGMAAALRADHRTGVHEQSLVQLPDGTEAHLNVSSALTVDFTTSRRSVTLLGGEAAFDATSEARRPFVVRIHDIEILGTGARFSVRDTGETAMITVSEGRIEIAGSGQHGRVEVRAGEQSRYDPGNGSASARKVDSATATAWREGFVMIDDMPFDAALAEVERYIGGGLLVLADTHRIGPVTARIAIDDVDAGLDALALANGLSVTRLPFLTVID
ncbi:MAG: FecR domain-containing protein [Pseudomonadota bacterium]